MHCAPLRKEPVKPSLSPDPVAALRRAGRALLGLLYPPLCLGCEARLPDAEPTVPLCDTCLRSIPRADAALLTARLADFPGGSASFGRCFALWLFDEGTTIQQVQHAAKYHNRPTLGVRLGRWIGEGLCEAGGPVPDLVVPVPLHRVRQLERGYNQSGQLARGIAEVLGADVGEELLVRRRATRSQTALDKKARWQNVADAFALSDPDAVAGRHVLLVDDVITTGATVVATAAPLRDAGASVDLAVLACTRE